MKEKINNDKVTALCKEAYFAVIDATSMLQAMAMRSKSAYVQSASDDAELCREKFMELMLELCTEEEVHDFSKEGMQRTIREMWERFGLGEEDE